MLKIEEKGFQTRFQLTSQIPFNELKTKITELALNYGVSVNINKEQVKIRNWNVCTNRRCNNSASCKIW